MNLSDQILQLPFVGQSYAKKLEKLGINTIEDLIFHFPFRYQDFTLISPISRLQAGEIVTITGTVEKITNNFTKTGKKIQEAIIADDTGKINAVWFNQTYLVKTFKKNEKYNFAGKIEWFGHKKVIMSPEYELAQQKIHTGRLVPIYKETYGVSSKWLRSRIKTALDLLENQIEEFLPTEIINQEKLLSEKEAVKQIHFPDNKTLAQKAKYRLAFDELFLIQLASLLRKKEWQEKVLGKQFFIDFEQSMKFVESLPFSLTNAQKRCLREILLDLQKNQPMNRLLQGDVGSGKTVVAALAAYTAFLNQSDTLFMAPTEILANQHYTTLKLLLEPFNVPIVLLTGSHKNNELRKLLNNGVPKIIVGTHALLYQEYNSERVGLVIVDEQHRFGVEQRKLLSQKGKAPHFLTMTATPIPRTIALTMYNDLDLSVIDEMPKGRVKIKTWVVPPEKRESAYNWIRSRIKGTPEQAFIICPLIEESETLKTVKAVTKEFATLAQKIFPDLKLGLIHGKLKSKDKQEVINLFREGKLDILVATPVVEVGIDIPNATIMMIEAADRFGLAQLHQLRGRVGRGNLQSYCLLFADDNSVSSIRRLKNLEKTNSGMQLAEIDLKLRGPGEIYGTAQHGFVDLRVASFTDFDLIQKTRAAALQVLASNPDGEQSLQDHNPTLKIKLEKYKIDTVNN